MDWVGPPNYDPSDSMYAEPVFDERFCRVCGCDDLHACVSDAGVPCHWVEDDLCSACAFKGQRVQIYTEAQASAYLRGRKGGAGGPL
jgi:hypothetical protein